MVTYSYREQVRGINYNMTISSTGVVTTFQDTTTHLCTRIIGNFWADKLSNFMSTITTLQNHFFARRAWPYNKGGLWLIPWSCRLDLCVLIDKDTRLNTHAPWTTGQVESDKVQCTHACMAKARSKAVCKEDIPQSGTHEVWSRNDDKPEVFDTIWNIVEALSSALFHKEQWHLYSHRHMLPIRSEHRGSTGLYKVKRNVAKQCSKQPTRVARSGTLVNPTHEKFATCTLTWWTITITTLQCTHI